MCYRGSSSYHWHDLCMVEAFLFFFGLIAGSTANALIDRLSRGESWFSGRSKCDRCKHVLVVWDLIPVVSYVSLSGKCRYCHSPIAVRNLVVEILMGVSFVVIGHISQTGPIGQIILMGIAWTTTIVFVMDQETMLVSDAVVLIWAILVVGYKLSVVGISRGDLIGFLIGVIVIGGIWAFSRGKAMGSGDIGIIGVIGLWVGTPQIFVALWMAFVLGAVVGCWLLVVGRRNMKSMIAFGPYLIVGGWIAHFWGDMIVRWIFRY